MHSVMVCRSCGRTINKEFVFCPWCGVSSVNGKTCGEIIDAACDRLEALQVSETGARFHVLEDSLDRLEKDLTFIMSQYEGL